MFNIILVRPSINLISMSDLLIRKILHKQLFMKVRTLFFALSSIDINNKHTELNICFYYSRPSFIYKNGIYVLLQKTYTLEMRVWQSFFYGGASSLFREEGVGILLFETFVHYHAPMQRGAFCKFPFRWIYYYGSNKSTKLAKRSSVQCSMSYRF